MKRYLLIAGLLLCSLPFCNAQNSKTDEQANYTQVITKRAEKIVDALNLTDSAKYKRVVLIIVDQYSKLSIIHDTRNQQAKNIKIADSANKAAANVKIAAIDSNVDKQLDKLHIAYLAKLGTELNAQQIDEVKDQMTYRILPLTYNAYLDEIPNLTDVQKAQIKAWLVEAREHAIDAESSEKKHAWFGKYKGRINNYLSAQGYDMKKEAQDWQQRRASQKG